MDCPTTFAICAKVTLIFGSLAVRGMDAWRLQAGKVALTKCCFCAKLGRFLAICLSYITIVTGVVFLLDSFCASSARLSAPVDIEAGMGAFDISSPRSGYFVDVMTSTRY